MCGHENLLKRLLVHASALNLGLWMRSLFGVGTPRGLQGRAVAVGAVLSALCSLAYDAIALIREQCVSPVSYRRSVTGSIRCT